MKSYRICLISILALIAGISCKNHSAAEAATGVSDSILGSFSGDSAYRYIADQVAFGPRVPGTAAHKACEQYLVDQLHRFGADSVMVQHAEVKAFNGDVLPIANIMGAYNIDAPKRILLLAHWDSRPWADMSSCPEKRKEPVLGANDGGSGVGVLLEIARNLQLKAPEVGVDILFVDAEDYGESGDYLGSPETWCLGSQYWTKNMTLYTPDSLPAYGILLDMVGGRDAHFLYEHFSYTKAPKPTARVWNEAEAIGHGERFVKRTSGAVTDDHIFLIQAGIPTTDIIEANNNTTGSFNPTWHTCDDNLENIDREPLKAVGETVLNVIYKEKIQ